ncbi:hypothetical protein [Anaerosalibacter sp. Marseille-P3206]|uniref:hypothetical protein n=1 Tax=Anaerosalibacter sp. Marseille-P3206 TaxID=1871005 RepID=UPI0009876E7E|nr:hypothetical protein [Anaerosalibacter sp. Marseille-P3206]
MKNSEYRDKLEKSLKRYFDLEYDKKIKDFKFDIVGKFYQRSSKYMLFREAEIYAFQTNEYIFYNMIDKSFNTDNIKSYYDFLNENVNELIDINEEHMSTIITFLFSTTDKLDEDTIKAVQKFKFHKNFKFGLRGWVDARIFIVNPLTEDICTNKFGRGEEKKFLFNENV